MKTTLVDPRGTRFSAAITAVVLSLALIAGPSLGLPLLIVQVFVFGVGTLLGLRFQPYGWLFRRFIRPRLGAPSSTEDERPPRFAQGVGLVFTLVAIAAALLASPIVFYVAVGFALVAAVLNAFFSFCLGCEMYLLGARLFGQPSASGRS